MEYALIETFNKNILYKIRIDILLNKNLIFFFQAIDEGEKNFAHAQLKVEWAPSAVGDENKIVPDLKRKPDQQITPAALLASLDDDEEEDDEAVHDNEDDN